MKRRSLRQLSSPWRSVQAMLDLQYRGAATVDYGNNIRQMALEEGVENAFTSPGFAVPAYIRPLFWRRHRSIPLGSPFWRPRRHLQKQTKK
ncbi:hypothetical protein OH492_08975 [Vibrio chagasii]|nr:hypothetical protein [Vibrio chagasii]